ncbi:hypothetical protein ACSTIZ_00385, partial [Vibrio parahaemolyticus]
RAGAHHRFDFRGRGDQAGTSSIRIIDYALALARDGGQAADDARQSAKLVKSSGARRTPVR